MQHIKNTPDTLVLATDLDGTFAGGSPRDRARLQAALAALEQATLLYVTGRSVPAALELIAEAPLPEPDILIADVGTTVVRGGTWDPVAPLVARIESRWPGADAVRERLADAPGLEEQDLDVPRRLSYWLRAGSMEDALREAARRLEDLDVDLVGSADTYVDVLPGGVNKGSTLLATLEWLGAPRETVVVAGDTLNDLALFETGLRGVVVGNCEPALRQRLDGRGQVYFAGGEGAAGIFEGLLHYGCLKEVARGE